MTQDKVEVEKAKTALKKMYDDGFNIYMMLNKLKKELKRKEPFPPAVILRFSDAYWKYKPEKKEANYPYFLKTFRMVSADWFANQNQQEHAQYKKEGMSQHIKDVLKGIIQ